MCMTKLLVHTSLRVPEWNVTEILLHTLKVYVGIKVGKKPRQWRQERHVCACVCVNALHWSSSLLPGSGCMWDLMTAYQLTTHMSLWWDAAHCWQKSFGTWRMKRAKQNVSVIPWEGRQMLGVYENIRASLPTRAGRGEDWSFCAFGNWGE